MPVEDLNYNVFEKREKKTLFFLGREEMKIVQAHLWRKTAITEGKFAAMCNS